MESMIRLKRTSSYSISPYGVTFNDKPLLEYVDSDDSDGHYVSIENGEVKEFKNIFIGRRDVTITDQYQDLIGSGIVTSPSECTPIKDTKELFERMIAIIETSVKFPLLSTRVGLAAYIFMTWFFNLFDSIPYIKFTGDFGTGKSTALKVLGSMCYRSVNMAGAVTAAPIFRMIKKVKGTFLIDEADFRKSDFSNDIIKILNCGYQKGFSVVRIGSSREPETFDVFCPKIIGTRSQFDDTALESRCFTTVMKPMKPEGLLPTHSFTFKEQTEIVRNQLLYLRLTMFENDMGSNIHDRKFKIKMDSNWEPRIQQIADPLLIMTPEEYKEQIYEFIELANTKFLSDRKDTIEEVIYDCVNSATNDNPLEYKCKLTEVYRHLDKPEKKRYPVRKIGAIMRNLGFELQKKNDGLWVYWDDNISIELQSRIRK